MVREWLQSIKSYTNIISITKSRWVVSWFFNLLFMNDKDLNVLSFSTLPDIWAWTISMIFMNSETFAKVTALLENLHQSWDIGFSIMSRVMATWAFHGMLKKEVWSFRLRMSRGGSLIPQHAQILATLLLSQVRLNVAMCPWNVASNVSINQYWG